MDSQPVNPTSSPMAGLADRERDRQFRLFAESISNLAWIANADGWIFWYNQRWFQYTGTTPQEMEGWGWQSVHDPTALPGVMERWTASIATGEPFDMIFPLKGADGVYRSFLTRIMPFKDDQGQVLRWFGTNTDISREIDAAEALRASEQRFRIATEAIGGILWTNTAGGQMHGEQPGWSAFTGQTQPEYQGYGWSNAIHPDDMQPTIEVWERCVREGCLFAFEHRVRRHDGVYRLCSIRALPIRNSQGAIVEWVGVHTDITEERAIRKALHDTVQALKNRQELLETAQIVSNVGFWRYQPSTETMYLSRGSRHLLGLPPTGELNIEDALACVHPDDIQPMRQALDHALTAGGYDLEFRTAPTPAGEFRWLRGAARILSAEDGTPYFVGMNLDITQQRLSAETLMRTEKLAVAGRLAASIAHEINNPLESVTNLLYLLLQGKLDPEQRNYAQLMSSELERVAQISTHTLRFHRQSTRATETDATGLLESVLTLYEGRLRNAGVATKRRFRATTSVFGFEGELRQVLANLVGNALDAMSGVDGRRTLALRTRNATQWSTGRHGLRITIADTGSGMTPQIIAHIFDAFFTTKGETGTGLGLWVSIEIVRKHHGALRVRSRQARHGGTVFQLFLPNSVATAAAPSVTESPDLLSTPA